MVWSEVTIWKHSPLYKTTDPAIPTHQLRCSKWSHDDSFKLKKIDEQKRALNTFPIQFAWCAIIFQATCIFYISDSFFTPASKWRWWMMCSCVFAAICCTASRWTRTIPSDRTDGMARGTSDFYDIWFNRLPHAFRSFYVGPVTELSRMVVMVGVWFIAIVLSASDSKEIRGGSFTQIAGGLILRWDNWLDRYFLRIKNILM